MLVNPRVARPAQRHEVVEGVGAALRATSNVVGIEWPPASNLGHEPEPNAPSIASEHGFP